MRLLPGKLLVFGHVARIEAHIVAELELRPPDFDAADLEGIFLGVDRHAVADADGRHDKAQIQGFFPADPRYALKQLRALFPVNEGNKGVAEVKGKLRQVDDGRNFPSAATGFLSACGSSRSAQCGGTLFLLFLLQIAAYPPACKDKERPHRKEDRCRGIMEGKAHSEEGQADDHVDRTRDREILPELLADDLFGRTARHEDTGCKREHQGRQLGNEAVTNRQVGIASECILKRHAAEHHTGYEAADEVEGGNENTGLDVSRDKLRGTVHRGIEVDFLPDQGLLAGGLLFRNDAGVHLVLDVEHLVVHRVQRKAGGNLRNAGRTLGDDEDLNDNEDDEYDETDQLAVAGCNVGEGLDHFALARHHISPRVGAGQDKAGRRYVDGKAKQGHQQDQPGEGRKVGGPFRIDNRQQYRQGKGDIDDHRQVYQSLRQGNEHHQNRYDDRNCDHAVLR